MFHVLYILTSFSSGILKKYENLNRMKMKVDDFFLLFNFFTDHTLKIFEKSDVKI